MNPGSHTGGQNLLRICIDLKATYICSDRTLEKLHVLRKIAYVLTAYFRRPMFERCMVQSDFAAHRSPHTHQCAHE